MMQPWFDEAKLGIFIHWGIYAVDGVDESWAFYNRKVGFDEYYRQLDGFTARSWSSAEWARLFRRSGAKYAVLTTKHHDGVALFDTKQSGLSVVTKTPAKRDLIAPYAEALRREGLKVGFYFSHLDWSHPDYSPIPPEFRTNETTPDSYLRWSDGPSNPAWQRFIEFEHRQLQELCTNYGQVDLLWFDGDWTPGAEWWPMAELRQKLHAWQPNVIINSRMCGHGDYATPEQGMPITAPEGPWEFCMTINDSWGYQGRDRNYKSFQQVLRTFVECLWMGGNLLLDIGPMEDGTIPPQQVTILEQLGEWIATNEEAVYRTSRGIPCEHTFCPSSLADGGRTLYLYLLGGPSGEVAIKGLLNEVRSVRVVGSGAALSYRKVGGAPWMSVPGVLWIQVPPDCLSRNVTVLKVELDEPIRLYRGQGQGITQN